MTVFSSLNSEDCVERSVSTMRSLLVLFISLACLTCGLAARAAGTQTAERCGANQDQPASRIFADSDGQGWHEYQDIKKVPELQLGSGAAARQWLGSTAWGWGYREEGPFAAMKLKPNTSEFFSTKTEQPVSKPEEADDIPEALKPSVYPKKSLLPFFKLLSK